MKVKAYPHSFERVPNHPHFAESEGMDLRDYFAAKAMGAIILHPQGPAGDWYQVAKDAYEAADAMMKAREA